MTDTLIILGILAVVGFIAYSKFAKKKKDDPLGPADSVPRPPTYQPDSSTIKDNESAARYREALAPTTRAHMSGGPYFAPDGTPLDVRGQPIRPVALVLVNIPPPTTQEQADARLYLADAIRRGQAYTGKDIIRAGFAVDSAEFASFHAQAKGH